jgi:hypothetical protein
MRLQLCKGQMLRNKVIYSGERIMGRGLHPPLVPQRGNASYLATSLALYRHPHRPE